MVAKQVWYLLLLTAAIMVGMWALPIVIELALGHSLQNIYNEEAIRLLGASFAFLTIFLIGFFLIFRAYYGRPLTRTHLGDEVLPKQAVFDGANLLIVGRTAADTLIIQSGPLRRRIEIDNLRAVIIRRADVGHRSDQLGFQLNNGEVVWRDLQFWDNPERRRKEVASLLNLP